MPYSKLYREYVEDEEGVAAAGIMESEAPGAPLLTSSVTTTAATAFVGKHSDGDSAAVPDICQRLMYKS